MNIYKIYFYIHLPKLVSHRIFDFKGKIHTICSQKNPLFSYWNTWGCCSKIIKRKCREVRVIFFWQSKRAIKTQAVHKWTRKLVERTSRERRWEEHRLWMLMPMRRTTKRSKKSAMQIKFNVTNGVGIKYCIVTYIIVHYHCYRPICVHDIIMVFMSYGSSELKN